MTVTELVTLLQTCPADAPVGVLTVSRVGIATDLDTAPAVTIDRTVTDDGTAAMVWITGVGAARVDPPSIVTWPCECGELLTVSPNGAWPDGHDEHPNHRHTD